MTGKRLKASVIIDLNGNLSRRSRQYSNQINALSRSGQSSLRALRMEVVRVSGAIDRMGSLSTRTFRMLSAGALGIAGVGYTANKLFIGAAAQREQQIIAMNSLYHGDKVRAQAMMTWAKQNAKDTTWGLSGVLQEIRTSTAFGMNDEQVKQFITMLQNQGAMHGWDLPTAQGASLQFKQMFARQQITAADANLLTGYGINVYKVLADATGEDEKKIRKLGEKGKLGLKSILTVFRTLLEQSKGAQAAAMNSWDGMFAQMEANLLEFRIKVANSGPFEEIKNEMRRVLNWHDMADKSGELDALAENIGQKFLTTFRTVKIAAQELWRWLKPGKDALAWVDQNIVSLKKLAAVLVSVWLANKALRAGWAVAKPSWQVASYPFKTGRRMWRWMRNRKRGQAGLPVPDAMTSETLLQGIGIQRVFVTNWPHGFGGYGSGGRGGRTRKGRGMTPLLPRQPLLLSGPQSLALSPPRSVPALPAPKTLPLPGKSGLLSRLAGSAAGQLVTGTVGKLADAGRAAGGWFSGIGHKLAGSAIGRVVTKGAGALGWMGKGAGRALSRLGGPVMGALQLAPVLMDEQASTHEKAGAIGSTAGAWLGGAVGSLAGPLGTVAGAT
ncbi:tape measure protein, partial [Escherichia coli]|uniref:tape measure protein n=2 Tax=Escherichia coli TaxID=562 RepID=UPI00136CD27B